MTGVHTYNKSKGKFHDMLSEINKEDLKTLFGTSSVFFIEKSIKEADIEDALTDYLLYNIDVSIGDVIKIIDVTYVVSLIYTDNSVDLITTDGDKINTGLYNVDFEIISKLNVMEVEI